MRSMAYRLRAACSSTGDSISFSELSPWCWLRATSSAFFASDSRACSGRRSDRSAGLWGAWCCLSQHHRGVGRYAPAVMEYAYGGNVRPWPVLAPLCLVLGAPFTLFRLSVRRSSGDAPGLREWAQSVYRGSWFRFMSQPYVIAVIFAGALPLLYLGGDVQRCRRLARPPSGDQRNPADLRFHVLLGHGRRRSLAEASERRDQDDPAPCGVLGLRGPRSSTDRH